MKSFILYSVLFLILTACTEPGVVFTEPQPQGIDFQAQIPLVYRGFFFCESDSSTVHINGKTIYKEKNMVLNLHLDEIEKEENLSLNNGNLEIKNWPETYPVDIIGDSIYSEIQLRDTLFNLSEKNRLKVFRGHQILNKQLGPDKWEVIILSLDSDLDLRLTMAFLPEDLERLEKITPVKDISTEDQIQLSLSPSIEEFQQIVREQLIFHECDIFTRLQPSLEL